MSSTEALKIVVIKPSKYGPDGYVDRFRWGFMPNSTLLHMKALTPAEITGQPVQITLIDEYVHTDLAYLNLLNKDDCTLLAIAGTQSNQFQRGLDLCAFALSRGVRHCIIGGPHPMTCDTSEMQGRGVSFALAEAELIWPTILNDVKKGGLRPVYGENQRWQKE